MAGALGCSEIEWSLEEGLGGRSKEDVVCSERSLRVGLAGSALAAGGGTGIMSEEAAFSCRSAFLSFLCCFFVRETTWFRGSGVASDVTALMSGG